MKIMKVTIELFIFAIFIIWNSHALDFEDREEDVIFSNIIFRHGDRVPYSPYRNDPYRNESCWPGPFGSMTQIGKDQHRRLGLWLRSRYDRLLGKSYNSQLVHVTTTQVERVQEAAEITLQTMFSQTDDEMDVLILHVIPTELDNVLGVRRMCRKYNEELKNILQSSQIQELDESNQDFYQFLSNHTGENVTSLMDISNIYDALLTEKIHNKTWPEWTEIDEKLMDRLVDLNAIRITLFANTTRMKRIKSGLLIGEIVENMNSKAQHRLKRRKMNIYSTHDDTIVNMLVALDLFEPPAPTYTATLGIELRHDVTKGHFVTIFYKSLDQEPIYLKLKECDVLCPLPQFKNLMKPLVPENWEQECDPQYDGPKNQISPLWQKI